MAAAREAPAPDGLFDTGQSFVRDVGRHPGADPQGAGQGAAPGLANPVTLVWQATGSCTIIDAVYNGTPLKQNLRTSRPIPAWDTDRTVPTCTPDAAGAPVQLGFPSSFPRAAPRPRRRRR